MIRTLLGPLQSRVDAILTEVEEGVAKRNLDFFAIPTALIRCTVAYEAPSWLCGHQGRTFYPVAISVADLVTHVLPRADAIVYRDEQMGTKMADMVRTTVACTSRTWRKDSTAFSQRAAAAWPMPASLVDPGTTLG